MSIVRKILKVLSVCCVCTVLFAVEHAEELGTTEEAGVTIEITKLDVNDSTLALDYTVRNESGCEAWVCNDIGGVPFEVFLASGNQTLLIRKRLDLPTATIWRRPPPSGIYVRLVPGASLTESVTLALPVSPTFYYAAPDTTDVSQVVEHLALEIGYYDEDLPALIHSIFAVVDASGLTSQDIPANIRETYFRGFRVRGALGSFDDINKDPYGQGFVYIHYSGQALTGEKTLRVDVNDVAIPYNGPGET